MNKTAIKNFAIWARVQLIEAAKQRAFEYEITENGENKPNVETIGGRLLTADEKKQRSQLISQIRDKGYTQVMEEAAYTWFNRFVALRYMEVNGYLPSKIRVFTDENNAFKPEIMKEAMRVELDGLDKNKVLKLLDEQNNEELYKYLLITQCNALNVGLPNMFEKIANWTELLFPANLLRNDSVVGQMISEIPEDDWTDAVQIIGWMYQYYNSELKDDTFALLKKNVKISKERIPAATQLFTPDWIVRYMVENSLGRLWYEGHNDFDKSQWKYYIDEAKQESEVEQQLKKIRTEYATIKPEDIKLIDPCMGSGHILVYAFDVLMQIYTSAGWSERDAARSIIENNLYGLDIDDRAGQLAYFAIMMKARKYSRRILNGDVKPNVLSVQDSGFLTEDFIAYVANKDVTIKNDLILLRSSFKDAKEYGSILKVPTLHFDALLDRIDIIRRSYAEDLFQAQYHYLAVEYLAPLIKQARIMAQKYDVVVTNPPYMGNSGMSGKLSEFVKKNYPDSKSDLFAVFIERCGEMCGQNGFQGMITQHAWMFLGSFEKMRENQLNYDIVSMAHLGARAFEEIAGEVVQTVAFVIRKAKTDNYLSTYSRLVDESSQSQKELAFLSHSKEYIANKNTFCNVPGSPVAYWINKNLMAAFAQKRLDSFAQTKQGFATGDNDKFLRIWHEVSLSRFSENIECQTKKWFPCNKGGSYRKWFGNNIYLANWENDGLEMKKFKGSVIRNPQFYFREGITWSSLANQLSLRYSPKDFVFESKGSMCFVNKPEDLLYILGLLNSKIAAEALSVLSPTLDFHEGPMLKVPVVMSSSRVNVNELVQKSIMLARTDWDSFETSWDFKRHPLVANMTSAGWEGRPSSALLRQSYETWEVICADRFNQLKANEEELNRIFIDIYGLQDELTPEVEDKDVTVRRADLQREIKSLISYAVGCMFGRYSLDVDGLAYAGGEWDASKYATFPADKDNIIPICDDEYFDDDIVARFVKFIETIYGKDTLEENLRFIADALGGKGASRDVIRSYFLNDFYADHLKTYQKRPIYWLFSSGKKNGFKALIYMHRYQPDLLARMRTDYVHEQQERYRTQLQMLEDSVQTAAPSERVKLNKQIAKLKDQSLEIQKYEEKIHHLADQMIPIDLDDGVKINYAKFEDVLEKLK